MQQELAAWKMVRILMVHRRFSSWLPSRYYQYRKYRMYGAPNEGRGPPRWSAYSPKSGKWDKRSLGDYLQEVIYAQDFAGDVAFTYQWYSDLFGPDAVRVVTMHDNDENDNGNQSSTRKLQDDTSRNVDSQSNNNNNNVLERFMCQAVNSPTACQLTKVRKHQNQIQDQNTNEHFQFDLDLLVVHAYHDYNLLGGAPADKKQKKQKFVTRHVATKVLQNRLQALQMTVQDDLPRLCLTAEQQDLVWQRTWYTEQLLWQALHRHDDDRPADGGPDKATVQRQFQADAARFCHVHAVATLQNETLRNLLFPPCLYWKENPCTSANGSNIATATR